MFSVRVIEQSQVAEARRRACREAASLGMSETDVGRVAIIATELATNLIRHGGGGELLVGLAAPASTAPSTLDLIALDRGPGIADLDACMRDGYSTAGGPGTGLGAIARQASAIDVYSRPGIGTAILARVHPRTVNAAHTGIEIAGVCISAPGETVSGDNWAASIEGMACTVLLADGLGHGPVAAEAANLAVAVFMRQPSALPAEALTAVHGALRTTRGAAVSVARLDFAGAAATFAGIGNVAGTLLHNGAMRKMVTLNGTAGAAARQIRAFPYALESGTVAVLHSDGLVSSWSLTRLPGVLSHDPALIAAVLYRDFARGRDDATVVVVKARQ